MHPYGDPRGERTENGLLALKLIELAVAAGWKPRECIGFAREAHKFVMSTLPEPATGLVACSSEPGKEIGRPSHPEWGLTRKHGGMRSRRSPIKIERCARRPPSSASSLA
jgi:hypothetical protein